MLWIYLIVQAVGFWIIAWCFETEDKGRYALTFRIGSLFSLLMLLFIAPLTSMLLTGVGVILFRAKINLIFADDQIPNISSLRNSLQILTNLTFTKVIPVFRPMLEPIILALRQYALSWRQEPRRANVRYANKNNNKIIDVKAIDVSRG